MGSVPAMRMAPPLLLVALALAACGSGSDGTTSSSSATSTSSTQTAGTTTESGGGDQSTVAANDPRAALEAVLTGGDCTDFVTDHFVAVAYGGEQACKQSTQAGGTAKSLDVQSLSSGGNTAKATVVPNGGPSSGDKLTVTLVKDGEDWKVDSLKSNVPVGP